MNYLVHLFTETGFPIHVILSIFCCGFLYDMLRED